MENIGPLLDMPSPPNSYSLYREDQYLDTHASGSESPINSHYDLSYVPDFTTIGDVYTSPEGEPDSPQEQEAAPATAKTPAKRKRENRYKNAPPSVLSRRRAQNRASQRAYRERKDQRIKDLEQMLNESKQRNDVLSQAYMSLEAEYNKLKSQLAADPTAATSYTAAATAAELTATFDSASLGLGPTTAADDMFGYRYPDLTTYAHM